MLIVGTSDVIHIMSKYLDELQKGNPRFQAIKVTVKEGKNDIPIERPPSRGCDAARPQSAGPGNSPETLAGT